MVGGSSEHDRLGCVMQAGFVPLLGSMLKGEIDGAVEFEGRIEETEIDLR